MDNLIFPPLIPSYATLALEGMQIFRWLYRAKLNPWLGIRAIEGFAGLRDFRPKKCAEVVLDLD